MSFNNGLLFSDWLFSVNRRYGDQIRLLSGEDELSLPALLEASLRCAAILTEKGMQKDDRVLLLAANGLDWLVSFFGIVFAGGVAALGNYSLRGHEITVITRLVKAKWAVLGVEDLFGLRPGFTEEAVCEGGVLHSGIYSCRELYRQSLERSGLPDDAFSGLPETFSHPRDTRVIMFTTGSTSRPKAVQLSSDAILTNVCSTMKFTHGDLRDSCIIALPLFHCYGLYGVLAGLEQGGIIYLAREISPQAVLEMIDQRKPDVLITVGTLYKLLVRLPEFPKKGAGKLKLCFWGGSKMTAADIESIEKNFGAAAVSGYGLTECSAVVSVSTGDIPPERRAAEAGRIQSCQEVGIWLKERGFVSPGETGEIVVKGPCLMNGYLDLPHEEQPIDDDGWLHTGDLGRIAEDGLLELKGRMKDLIKCAGENIAPGEIEEALLSESGVAEARVFGIPDPVLGERVEACVVLRSGEMDERRLRTSLRKKLSPHKVPVHVVAFPAFPVSASGKTDQIRLRKMLMQRLSEMSPDGRL